MAGQIILQESFLISGELSRFYFEYYPGSLYGEFELWVPEIYAILNSDYCFVDWRSGMITIESMMSITKGDLQEASKRLSKDDIPQLVEWLSLKDDNIRYQAFLILQNRSVFFDDVYPYWDTFCAKLKNDNSYQRSIGLMLVAENTKWDQENRIENALMNIWNS